MGAVAAVMSHSQLHGTVSDEEGSEQPAA